MRDRVGELDLFEQAKKGFFREGISSSRIYLHPGREGVGDILVETITGVHSSLTYAGAKNLAEFGARVTVGVQSSAGFFEGTPHGKVR